jgi:hypothetical protein
LAAVRNNLLCTKHGAHGICSINGCETGTSSNKRDTICTKHKKKESVAVNYSPTGSLYGPAVLASNINLREKKICKAPNCTGTTAAKGLCYKHGAFGMCLVAECKTAAISKGKGCCYKHSAKPSCTAQDCTTKAVPGKKGFCYKHSAKPECTAHDCTLFVVARGLCTKHGAFGFCSAADCMKGVLLHGGGRCSLHKATNAKWCKCGSSAHQRTSFKDCPLNLKNTTTAVENAPLHSFPHQHTPVVGYSQVVNEQPLPTGWERATAGACDSARQRNPLLCQPHESNNQVGGS